MNAKFKTALLMLGAVSVATSLSAARDPGGRSIRDIKAQTSPVDGVAVADGAEPEDASIPEPERMIPERDEQNPGPGARPRTIEDLVAESDLVFRGKVMNIQYKLSEPTPPDGGRIPHTFVTFAMNDLLHGAVEGDTVTLRFMGGWDERSMLFMSSSHAPQFDLGDEDILFVKDNTVSMSPITEDQRGRLRIVDDQVFTDGGRAVILGDDGTIIAGNRHALDEVETTTVKDGAFVLQNGMAPDAIAVSSQAEAPETIVEEIKLASLFVPAPKRFVNADQSVPFDGPDFTPAAPPAALLAEEIEPEEMNIPLSDRP